MKGEKGLCVDVKRDTDRISKHRSFLTVHTHSQIQISIACDLIQFFSLFFFPFFLSDQWFRLKGFTVAFSRKKNKMEKNEIGLSDRIAEEVDEDVWLKECVYVCSLQAAGLENQKLCSVL